MFSAVKQKIVAVSVANSAAYDAPRPSGFEGELWEANGWRVDLRFQELDQPVKIADILVDRIMTRHCVDPGTTGAIYP